MTSEYFTSDGYDINIFIVKVATALLTKKSLYLTITKNRVKKLSILKFLSSISFIKYQVENERCMVTVLGIKSILDNKIKLHDNYNDGCSIVKILLLIGGFLEDGLNLKIQNCVTNNKEESIDCLSLIFWKIFRTYEIRGMRIEILRRSFMNEDQNSGGGIVNIKIPRINFICGVDFKSTCLIKTGGVITTARINSDFSKRMTRVMQSDLEVYTDDIKIIKNVCNRDNSTVNPGFECVSYVETIQGIIYSFSGDKSSPEECASQCVEKLVKSIKMSTTFDFKLNEFMFFFMSLASGLSSVVLVDVDDNILEFYKDYFGIEYNIQNNLRFKVLSLRGFNLLTKFS